MLRSTPAAATTSRRPGAAATFVLAGMMVLGSACADAPEGTGTADARTADAPAPTSIVDVAVAAGQFSLLLRAVDAAGLTETLHTDGPFTVFAPTDGAFASLPEGALDGLLADPDALSRVLLYHVVPGELTLRELRERAELETAQGEQLRVELTRQGITINDTYLLTSDIRASNGVIHVVTSVLLPDPE